MKSTHILAAGIAALCIAQSADAATRTVRITGSSAFRSAVTNALKNVLSSGNPAIAYQSAGSFSSSNYSTFVGTLPAYPGDTFVVKCSWSGSVAGIRDVSTSQSIVFLPDGVTTSTGSGTSVASPGTTVEGVPDIAFADNTQNSTIYRTPALTGNSAPKVGVIPFAFVASKDTTANLTNLTRQQFNQLYTGGFLKASVFTGNSTDTQYIYAFGRDPFSGTRLTTLAETGYGTLVNVAQYKPVISSGNITNIDYYVDTATVPDVGNDGESSGGNLADYMRYNSTTTVTDLANGKVTNGSAGFLAYLGEADSYRAVYGVGSSVGSNGARYLTYEGVKGFDGKTLTAQTASISTSSNTITLAVALSNVTDIVDGQIVTGTGIAPGSVVTSHTTTTVTLDKTPTLTNAAQTGIQIGSLLPVKVRGGSYPFWNYEQMLWKPGTPGVSDNIVGTTGFKYDLAVAVRDEVKNNTYGFSGLADDASFLVRRLNDGGPISLKNP